jgi:hypothetical protein
LTERRRRYAASLIVAIVVLGRRPLIAAIAITGASAGARMPVR